MLSAAIAKPKWHNIIENRRFSETVRLVGSKFNNTLVRNITIENVNGDGIFIKDVENLRIENIIIRNIKKGSGIRLSMSGSTSNVSIINNQLENISNNGINVGQRSKKSVDHKNLLIAGNTIKNACTTAKKGLHHAIYVQAQDFYIVGNRIFECPDGNGISLRSSGVVEKNVIKNTGKSGIAYYDDHKSGPSNTLRIEHNIIRDYGQDSKRNAIDILPLSNPNLSVRKFIIRNNDISDSNISIENKKLPQIREFIIENNE